MKVLVWYFGFHAPSPLRECWAGRASWYSVLGHVEAFGYTRDDTWVFLDPQGCGTALHVTHRHDEVEELMAWRWMLCREILRVAPSSSRLVLPFHGPMNCVTQCAALMGWRAYTPRGFRRMLLANGAEIIHGPQGRPCGQGGAPEGAPDCRGGAEPGGAGVGG